MIAMRFAEAVTIRMPLDMHRGKTVQSADIPVDCSGRFSIYEGLKVCVPIITSGLGRYHRDSEQRNGLTDVEFNKALSAADMCPFVDESECSTKLCGCANGLG